MLRSSPVGSIFGLHARYGVITYRDSVPSNLGWFTAEPYYDIRSLEILRGPQGTFVGANAIGGAVFITSNEPVINGGVHGYVLGQAGNYNSLGGQGAINIPIGDTMAARVALYADTRDSFYNITGPYSGDDGVRIYERWKSMSARPATIRRPKARCTLSSIPTSISITKAARAG